MKTKSENTKSENTYAVRKPGETAWADGLTLEAAEAELARANRVCPGHCIAGPDGWVEQ